MSEEEISRLPKKTVESFRRIGSIDYPRDREGDLVGMVHANLQVRFWAKSFWNILLT